MLLLSPATSAEGAEAGGKLFLEVHGDRTRCNECKSQHQVFQLEIRK